VGVNWGQFGYPTVTSRESVYAVTKLCFQEAAKRGASVEVIIGDESGIEIVLWGGTTMDNFEHTGILHAAVLAGLERAASLEEAQPEKFAGARKLLEEARAGQVTRNAEKMMKMARQAGVRVVAFDEVEIKQIPVHGARHYLEGILVPKIAAEEVTDLINLPKPPGRHLIMGNTGLTGALKNHIGILAGSQRSPGLHGLYDRYPPLAEGQTKDSYLENLKARREAVIEDKSGKAARKFLLDISVNWGEHPGMPFGPRSTSILLR
jgi:hypothetical protein